MSGLSRKIRRHLIKQGKLRAPVSGKLAAFNSELVNYAKVTDSKIKRLHPTKGWR